MFFFCSFASGILLAQAETGEEVYGHHCGLCHQEKGAGTIMLERRLGEEKAVLEERNNLSEAYIRAVVRKGIGTMQGVSRDELDDENLQLISRYLTAKKPQD